MGGPKTTSASLDSLEADAKYPELSGKKFLIDFDDDVWSRSLIIIALERSHSDCY